MNNNANWDLIVLGGGAAGFFCAVNAARLQPAWRICLIEKTSKLLTKVSVSGGGRCNVTHACFDVDEFSRHYPRGANFVKKAFHHFSPANTVDWFRERGVTLKTEKDGRMFPSSDDSATIVSCLLQEASKYRVDIKLSQEAISIDQGGQHWIVTMKNGQELVTSNVCVAIGGMNKAGMESLFQSLHLKIVPSVPSLFTFNMPSHPVTKLMGVSVPHTKLRILETKLEAEGPLLVTHWGLSGPAVLRLSAWGARELAERQYQFKVRISWLPEHREDSLRDLLQQFRHQLARQTLVSRCPFALPQRLWEYLLLKEAHVAPDKRWADLSQKETNQLIRVLLLTEWAVKGKTSFKEEFVTAGGIDLSEIDHRSMQAKRYPGLYFAGEIMDVDGITGGFNFQHAWTSAWLAASSMSDAAAS